MQYNLLAFIANLLRVTDVNPFSKIAQYDLHIVYDESFHCFQRNNFYIFQLPTFRDGDVVVNESSAICLYLEVTVIHEQLHYLISSLIIKNSSG